MKTNKKESPKIQIGPYYGVFQAEKMELKGIKLFHDMGIGAIVASFPTIEDARNYMAQLISTIKHEQGIGWRTKNNLNPEESLDFLLLPIYIQVSAEKMIERGWKLPKLSPSQKLTCDGSHAKIKTQRSKQSKLKK